MSFSEMISPLVGRAVLAWFFLSGALSYATQWEGTIGLMTIKGVPAPALLLALGVIVMILGSLSLLAFTIGASVLMHNYWRISDVAARDADYQIFARNIAIAGALLLLVGMGPGPFALDNRVGQKKKQR